MSNSNHQLLKWTRIVGIVEGISLLALFLVAMPLKYMAGMPKAVTWVGSIHGGLFVLFALMIFYVWGNKLISGKLAVQAFIASIVPFGTFVIDKKLAQSQPA